MSLVIRKLHGVSISFLTALLTQYRALAVLLVLNPNKYLKHVLQVIVNHPLN